MVGQTIRLKVDHLFALPLTGMQRLFSKVGECRGSQEQCLAILIDYYKSTHTCGVGA